MLKGSKTIKTSFDVTPADVVENINGLSPANNFGYMFKIVDQKVKWCPLDNKIYAFCYEHGKNFDLSFPSFDVVRVDQN